MSLARVGDTRTLHSTSDNAGSKCVCVGLFLGCISAPTEQRPDNDRARKNSVPSDRLMRDAHGGLGDIPSGDKAGALPASHRSRRVKARGQVCGPRGRPFQQRVIAACRALPWYDFTLKHRGRHGNPSPRFGACVSLPGLEGARSCRSDMVDGIHHESIFLNKSCVSSLLDR